MKKRFFEVSTKIAFGKNPKRYCNLIIVEKNDLPEDLDGYLEQCNEARRQFATTLQFDHRATGNNNALGGELLREIKTLGDLEFFGYNDFYDKLRNHLHKGIIEDITITEPQTGKIRVVFEIQLQNFRRFE